MAASLSKKQLLQLLLEAIDESEWSALIASATHPFLFHVYRGDQRGFNLRVYIWNCTHGGKTRADSEFRIQLTGVVPEVLAGEVTLLLGWHSGYGVFAGFDISKHTGQDAASPSIQIQEDALSGAHTNCFGIHVRANQEIAVAFRPEFLVDYALNASALHATGEVDQDLDLLNDLNRVTDADVNAITNGERKKIVSEIVRKYRAYDFRDRVLSAYGNKCAVCGIQLELIDAAHIIPVADPASNDHTTNGVALCKLHHAAFDRNLISFDHHYRIEVSNLQVHRLTTSNLAGGLGAFRENLLDAIILPADRRDFPKPSYITRARTVRHWGR